ncbi:MAG TPA: VOC family protein [Chloroflexia bacterium]|nr:VOC family protein [Chloroflexia bacterium]
MQEIKFNGINHFALITPDMEQTVRFYRDILGLPLVGAVSSDTFRHYFFDLGNHNTLAFFEYKGVTDTGGKKESGVPGSGRQFDHLSFNVENEAALLGLQERLREQGVEVTRVVDHDFIQSIYFTDPSGIELEASYWVRDITEQPALNDANPVPALKEQLERQKLLAGSGSAKWQSEV